MKIDQIIEAFNRNNVEYLLIGGVNFLLRHEPYLTFDIDFWIKDDTENLKKCEKTLAEIGAEWGTNDSDWEPVAKKTPGWLGIQAVFCLTSPLGAINIFRSVPGLDSWEKSNLSAVSGMTESGVEYKGISDLDMLRCQEALPESMRKLDRIKILNKAIYGK